MPDLKTTDPVDAIQEAVMRAANLEAGRWAVRVLIGDVPETGEVAVQAVASVRVFGVIKPEERNGEVSTESKVQALAARLGAELRRVIDARDLDAETMRRLHEEATERAARLRLALEALATAAARVNVVGVTPVAEREALVNAITAAREVLA